MQRMVNRLNSNHNPRNYNMSTIVDYVEVGQQPAQRRVFIAANTTQAILQHQPEGAGTAWVAVP